MITAAFIIGKSIMLSVTGDSEYPAMSILAGPGFPLVVPGSARVLKYDSWNLKLSAVISPGQVGKLDALEA